MKLTLIKQGQIYHDRLFDGTMGPKISYPRTFSNLSKKTTNRSLSVASESKASSSSLSNNYNSWNPFSTFPLGSIPPTCESIDMSINIFGHHLKNLSSGTTIRYVQDKSGIYI